VLAFCSLWPVLSSGALGVLPRRFLPAACSFAARSARWASWARREASSSSSRSCVAWWKRRRRSARPRSTAGGSSPPGLAERGVFGLVRLMASTTVARYHLRAARSSGWLAGIACGPTGTGKTLAARILCRIFGLDEATTIRLVESETERSLWGRREQVDGTWTMARSAVLDYPLVVLDEIDKAPSDLRTAVLKLLQGETRVPGEGDQVLAVAPAVLAITNGAPASIRAEYRRRAVVVDTSPLLPVLGDLDQVARRILTPGTLARIDLGAAVPPLAELDEDSLDVMRTLLRQVLRDAAWRECDRQGVELAALGRLAPGARSRGRPQWPRWSTTRRVPGRRDRSTPAGWPISTR